MSQIETTLDQMKQTFLDASNIVADEIYPKNNKKRGRYLLDQAMIYTVLEKRLRRKSNSHKNPLVVQSNILSEEITFYFEEHLGGVYSDSAWYKLLETCYAYKIGEIDRSKFLNYLEFTFNFDGDKDLVVVEKRVIRRLRKLQENNK